MDGARDGCRFFGQWVGGSDGHPDGLRHISRGGRLSVGRLLYDSYMCAWRYIKISVI